MSHIQIRRPHQLGLEAARKIAFAWAEKAEEKLDMECTYEEGDDQDTVHFTRAGVNGTLQVYPDLFELDARLGFLVSAFKHHIEAELNTQFDKLLAPPRPSPPRKKRAEKKRPVGRSGVMPRRLSAAIRSGRCTAAWPRRRPCP